MEVDRSENVRTIPAVFGVEKTKMLGVLLVILEIMVHHFMPVQNIISFALDISSIIALLYIFFKVQDRNGFFYKLFVDGTMILRFLFLYFAYTFI